MNSNFDETLKTKGIQTLGLKTCLTLVNGWHLLMLTLIIMSFISSILGFKYAKRLEEYKKWLNENKGFWPQIVSNDSKSERLNSSTVSLAQQ